MPNFHDFFDDKPRDKCGVMALYGHPRAAELTYLGLFALQHRGQESAGIVSSDGQKLIPVRGMGLLADVFRDQSQFKVLEGSWAIGHVRYSTTGSSSLTNVQPLVVNTKDGVLAVGHNGNITNEKALRRKLESEGAIFQTTSDSELFVHLIARSKAPTISERLAEAAKQLEGAFSVVLITADGIVVARDPHGFRPLAMGRKGDAYVFASETCAFDLIGATYERDVMAGEILTVTSRGCESLRYAESELSMCVFELIYFARPDSHIYGTSVDKVRRKLGKILAEEHPVDADIVISIPDSSNTSALGFSHRSGVKYEIGLIRNHYIGRTFINPSQFMRSYNSRIKYNAVRGVLEGRRVVVVDDSIVRGTTLKKIVASIWGAGASEVHVRIASPPVRWPCFYGMDYPTRRELIAAFATPKEIESYLGVNSLRYLSLEGVLEATRDTPSNYCTACFSGNYPVKLTDPAQIAELADPDKEWARAELEKVLRTME
ncbi:MAG: amidophosphoribosyltransferase [Calditrichaeota bacterium]|nr:amidophosphoribosyltransferase [Calditrichota bacterium]MCB9391736.1 amidophosphoribosyltransferase [Calditrichota bacterium]